MAGSGRQPQLVGYARVNTFDHDPGHQIRVLREAGCEMLFADILSGLQWSSAAWYMHSQMLEWRRALDYLQAGDTLVVWKLDRVAWTLLRLVRIVLSLKARGVHFCALDADIDTRAPQARATFFGVMTMLRKFHHSLRSEQVQLVIQDRKQNDQRWGRRAVFDDPGKLELVKTLLRDSEVPRKDIAKLIGISEVSLYRWFPGGDPDRFGQGQYKPTRTSQRAPPSLPVGEDNGPR